MVHKTKLFKIEDFDLFEDSIEVFIGHISTSDYKIPLGYEIDKIKFETFLKTEGKLEWIMDYSEAGEHVQKTGTLSIEEYWERSSIQSIKEDIYDYLYFKFIK